MPAERTAVIHIGVEKTGTSSIQRFLEINRQALIGAGTLYPTLPRNDRGSQWGLVARVSDSVIGIDLGQFLGLRDSRELEQYRLRLDASLEQQIAGAGTCRKLIVSSEHFHSRLKHRGEIERLRKYLQQWCSNFIVVMYVRRQDRLAVSRFSTALKSGRVDWNVFPYVGRELPYYFDFWSIYRNWSAVFGAGQVRVGVFERGRLQHDDIVSDFAGRVDIGMRGKTMPERVNESLSKAGADFVREVNRQLQVVEHGLRNRLRERIIGWVAQIRKGRMQPACRDDAFAFYRAFSESNQALAAALFPGRKGPLFSEDFGEYPVTFDWAEPEYEDAVGIAIELVHKASGLDEVRRLQANNFHLRGMLALKDGESDRASEMFQSALQIDREHFGANFHLARLLCDRGELAAGREHLDKAVANAPDGHNGIKALCRKYLV